METDWKFDPEFDSIRRARLESFGNFERVLDVLLHENHVVGAWICEATDLGQQGCWRPAVELDVGRECFDAFYNSPSGYRAQYLISPENGQSANGRLLQALEPKLSSAVFEDCPQFMYSRDCVRNSFYANSAKIWPNEADLDPKDVARDLAIEKWCKSLAAGNDLARLGLWAPEGSSLMVLGAFIDPRGNEIVSQRKIKRRYDIHECGFT